MAGWTTVFLLVATAAALGLAALRLATAPRPEAVVPAAAVSMRTFESAALAHEVALERLDRVERRLSRVSAELQALGQAGTQAGGLALRADAAIEEARASEEAEHDDLALESLQERDERAELQAEETLRSLDSRLAREPREARWAGEAESQIADLFAADELTGSALRHAGCKSTLCRIELSHEDLQAELEFGFVQLTAEPFRSGPGLIARHERLDGSVDVTIYVSRAGSDLFEPDH